MSSRTMLFCSVFVLALPLPAYSSSIQISQTGQTKCYESRGIVIDCAGTGQDGEMRSGKPWPEPRFTNIDGSEPISEETILDQMTGLVWAKDGNLMNSRDPSFDSDEMVGDGCVTWQHALDYVAKLNAENYLGFSDWRLPNVNELESLTNAGQNTAEWLNASGFRNVRGRYYWSSDSDLKAGNSKAQIVGFYFGDIYSASKEAIGFSQINVWPVRSVSPTNLRVPQTGQNTCFSEMGSVACSGTGQDGDNKAGVEWPAVRFTNPNGSVPISGSLVVDQLTGLIWPKDAGTPPVGSCGGGPLNWQQALDYVSCLNSLKYLGYSDWRLPNKLELGACK